MIKSPKHYSLKILQQAMNQAASLDPAVPGKLKQLSGKVIQLVIVPLQVKFFITFQNERIVLIDHYDTTPDTVIQSSPLGFIRLSLLPISKARSLFHDEVKLSGDTELGQQVKQIFDELDIDWEGHLAHFTGDVVAYQIGSLFRRGLAFKNQLKDSVCDNLSEYLQEEAHLFPGQEEVNDFFEAVDLLAQDTARLEAKMAYLNMSEADESH